MNKSQLRKYFRDLRRQIPETQREEAALAAALLLAAQTQFQASKNIACYLNYKSEFITTKIIEMIWQAKKQCFLPVLQNDKLHFVLYEESSVMQANHYGILEPVNRTNELNPDELDIVIIPLLAFDLHGNRLGAGGGFYDKTFSGLTKKPYSLGLAYAMQQADNLPVDDWDIKLDSVLTEKSLIQF